MTSRGAAERDWPATQPEQDAGLLEAHREPDARQAELYAAMGKVNIQALWTQAADLMPAQPAPRAVPSWCAVDHESAETAQLFVLSDAPVIEALRLDRTEVWRNSRR